MTVFSLSTLNHLDALKGYFETEKPLKQIEELSSNGPSSYPYGPLRVTWIIVTAPFRVILSIFLETMSALLFFTSYSRSLMIASTTLLREIDYLWGQFSYGSKLLVPATNMHVFSDSEIYLKPSIKRDDILEEELRSALVVDPIEFYLPEGICFGGVLWFNHLLHCVEKERAFKAKFPSLTLQASAVAKLFVWGMPKQAALLQALNGAWFTLLDIEADEHPKTFSPALSKSRALKALQEGMYVIAVHGHAISYIKRGDEQLIWNPVKGLVAIENIEELREELEPHVKPDSSLPIELYRLHFKQNQAVANEKAS